MCVCCQLEGKLKLRLNNFNLKVAFESEVNVSIWSSCTQKQKQQMIFAHSKCKVNKWWSSFEKANGQIMNVNNVFWIAIQCQWAKR